MRILRLILLGLIRMGCGSRVQTTRIHREGEGSRDLKGLALVLLSFNNSAVGWQASGHPLSLPPTRKSCVDSRAGPHLYFSRLSQSVASPLMQESPGSALRAGWDRGSSASDLRALVEAAASDTSARKVATAVSSSTSGWKGLWVARIQHFEKVGFTGLRVRPHYDLADDGGIVSHVHIILGPLSVWASASGFMKPATDGTASVKLVFDDFWMSGDVESPRDAPSQAEASAFDSFTRWLGRSLFLEGLAGFPVDYADMKTGLVAFRFTPLDSIILAQRMPADATPQRCPDS